MIVFLSHTKNGGVMLRCRAESAGAVGDIMQEVGPDQTFQGHTGTSLAKMPEGEYDLDPVTNALRPTCDHA